MKVSINFELDDILHRHLQKDTMPKNLKIYIREIIKRLSETGIDQINWRATIGGKALYHSNILQRLDGHYFGLYSQIEANLLLECDPLQLMIEECRKCKVSPWVWLDAFDCFIPGMQETEFEKHQNWLLMSRDQKKVLAGIPCYANKNVQEYRARQIKELSAYDIDGIIYSLFNSHAEPFVKLILGSDFKPYNFGFNPEIVYAYHTQYKIDILKQDFDVEAWAKLQAKQLGEYLKLAKKILAEHGQFLDLVIRRDNHVAGSMYPACYIANDYKQWHDMGVCDSLIIEGVDTNNLDQAIKMSHGNPYQWGIWNTLWRYQDQQTVNDVPEGGVPLEITHDLLNSLLYSGNFSQVLFHEVDALEFAMQGGTRDQAYSRLAEWVKILKP